MTMLVAVPTSVVRTGTGSAPRKVRTEYPVTGGEFSFATGGSQFTVTWVLPATGAAMIAGPGTTGATGVTVLDRTEYALVPFGLLAETWNR